MTVERMVTVEILVPESDLIITGRVTHDREERHIKGGYATDDVAISIVGLSYTIQDFDDDLIDDILIDAWKES